MTRSTGLKKPTDAYICIYFINARVCILIYCMTMCVCVRISACGYVDAHVCLYICAYVCAYTVCVSINGGAREDHAIDWLCGYHQ